MMIIPDKFCIAPWVNLYLDADGQMKSVFEKEYN